MGFCSNSGPAFIIGAVGSGVFHSGMIGILLYAIHIISAMITGLFFRSGEKCGLEYQPPRIDEVVPAAALVEAVKRASASLLSVCSFVILFSVFTGMLDCGGALSVVCGFISGITGLELHFMKALFFGLLELGSGVGAMQGLTASPLCLSLAAGIVGWGGLSVQMQTAAVLYDSNIKGTLYLTGRLISAILSSVLAYLAGCVMF